MLIGKGKHRSCYHHPLNPGHCIKVFHTWTKRTRVQCLRELKYIKRYKSKPIDLALIPNYFGTIATNYGVGYIFEKVTDWDGNESESLSSYFAKNSNEKEVGLLITNMYHILLDKKALVSDVHPGNILVQKKDSKFDVNLVLVDGIGNSDFIKICDYSDYLMKKKLIRKFTRLKKTLGLAYDDIA